MSVKVNNLLLRLITRSEGSRFIVILDACTNHGGKALFKNFIASSLGHEGQLILLDNDLDHFGLSSDIQNKIDVHPVFGNSTGSSNELELIKNLPQSRDLFLDSLAPLMILHPESSTEILSSLKKKFNRIVALTSIETLTHYDLLIVRELADTIIELNQESSTSTCQATITHKKSNSRVGLNLVRVKENFTISKEHFSYVKPKNPKEETKMEDVSSSTIENLPFNLRSADEDSLFKKKSGSLNLQQKGGKVYYEPGEEDDVDEEDPDEDLLI